MSPQAWFTVAVVLVTGGALALTRIAPDLLLVAALTALMVGGVLTPADALAGLGNPGLATVGVLYVVAAGLTDTGAIHALGARLLGRPRSLASAQLRLMLPVTGLSAFLNNTPVVAMLVPVVEEWARRARLPVSRLMIPLSYAAILGGTCTVIGTSTNLVVAGLAQSTPGLGALGFFEIAAVGLPTALIGVAFVVLAGRVLLPDRRPPLSRVDDPREYAVELLVDPSSPVVGRDIEGAGLRHLPGVFLAEVQRDGQVMPAVAPTERLLAGDRLVFVGAVDSIADLMRMRGLVPAPDQLFKLDAPRPERRVFEAVVAAASPMLGQSIRDGGFRNRYDAVVLAVARDGRRLAGKVGDTVLQAGDTLLVEARPEFRERQRDARDFLLVSEVRGAPVPRHERAWIATAILAGMVAAATFELLSMLEASLLAAGAMLVAGCTTTASARASVDWSVLVVIGASFGLGRALESTGAAHALAATWIGLAGDRPWLALAAVYVVTSFLTEVITNNAAAVLLFPIVTATASSLGVSPWPFVIAIMMAASASFATPIGYQTNLMVYGPGGYRFGDYLRIGLPMNVIVGLVAIALIPMIWPF